MSRRTERLNHLIRSELSELIQQESNDPRLAGVVISVTEVRLTEDLRHARVYISLMGDEKQSNEAFTVLVRAIPFYRHELSGRLDLRQVPALIFERDTSLERGDRVLQMLKEIRDQ